MRASNALRGPRLSPSVALHHHWTSLQLYLPLRVHLQAPVTSSLSSPPSISGLHLVASSSSLRALHLPLLLHRRSSPSPLRSSSSSHSCSRRPLLLRLHTLRSSSCLQYGLLTLLRSHLSQDVKCPGCFQITTVFSHASTAVQVCLDIVVFFLR